MSLKFGTWGDWSKAGIALRGLSRDNRLAAFKAAVDKDGRMIRQKLVGHIDKQDLNWAPLARKTVELKGHDKIYVETGTLRNGLVVRRVSSPKRGYSIFIGASPWAKSADGGKLSDIMIYMEYGTFKQQARPLIRPTWREVREQVKADMRAVIRGIIKGGVNGGE